MRFRFGCCAVSVMLLAFAPVGHAQDVNVVVDMDGVDREQYYDDLDACQNTGGQVEYNEPEREGVARNTARVAAVGAAAGAISGGSGSQGAKTGAAVGLAASATRNARNRRQAETNTNNEIEQVVKNCMRGRGYNVLN